MRIVFVSLLGAALLGCERNPTGSDALGGELPLQEQVVGAVSRRVAGIDTAILALPARARAGGVYEFTVPVASGGCLGADTTITRVAQRQVTIWPYQTLFLNAVCPAIYLVDRRTIRVTIAEPGEARIRIVSRNGSGGELTVIERRVIVE